MEGEGCLHADTEPRDEVTEIIGSSHDSGEIPAFTGRSDASAVPTTPPTSTVLLVGKCSLRETGNATTLARFRRAVEGGGRKALAVDPDSLPHTAALQALVTRHNIVTVLGLHAYRSAHVLLSCQELGVPYAIVFGGTDIHTCVDDAEKLEAMRRVVVGAKSLATFIDVTRDVVLRVWPSLSPDKIHLLPQAVEVNTEPDFDVLSYLEAVESAHLADRTHDVDHKTRSYENKEAEKFVQSPAGKYERMVSEGRTVTETVGSKENVPPAEDNGVTAQNEALKTLTTGILCKSGREGLSETLELPTLFQPLVLLVAGLRPVKDVLYLTEAWSKWQQGRGGRGRFLILGPSLEPQYAEHVHTQVARLSGVRVCPTLTPGECQDVMRSATVLVNSSTSEGMSNAILEAMAMGTPVIARDIYGNAAVITHGHTGLLYSSPDAFIQELDRLLQDSGLRDRLVTAAKEHIIRFHSHEKEKDVLLRIVEQTMQ